MSEDSADVPGDAAIPDAALLAAHVAGDPEAFGALVRRHQDRLWSVALRTCQNPEDASDALQEALISALRNAHSFRGESQVSTWLHRIVVNASIDRIRRRRSRPTIGLDQAFAAGIPEPTEEGDRIERRETILEVERGLAALPVDQRAALVLVDIEGLSVSEAAHALGVPVGTVKSRCHRGRARLAVLLAHLDPGNPDPHDGVPSPVEAHRP